MKLAIAGGGGAAKTTIAGTLARHLARGGYGVLALDNDLNPNLSLTVGVDAERMSDLPAMGADVARVVDGRLELTQTLDEIRAAHALTAPDGVTVLVAGEPKEAGYGRMGRRHLAVRTVVSCSRWPAISASPARRCSPTRSARASCRACRRRRRAASSSPTRCPGTSASTTPSARPSRRSTSRPDSPTVVAIGDLAGRLIRAFADASPACPVGAGARRRGGSNATMRAISAP